MATKQITPNVPAHCAECLNRTKSAFKNLDNPDLDEVSKRKSCVFFRKGQVMMQEGARPQGVYCIYSGKAKLFKRGNEGKEQIMRLITDGGLIGYRSILSDEPLGASIVALEDTHVCYIPKTSFLEVIESNPKFSLNVLKISCNELGEAGKIITSLAQKNVRERLAEVLLLLGATFGHTKEGYLDISLTREELANMIGTATESAIRLLSELSSEGLITLKGRKIALVDPIALKERAAIFD